MKDCFMKTQIGSLTRRCSVLCLVAFFIFLQGGMWQGRAWYLTDGNSVVHVDDTHPIGMNLWTVDGVPELYSQGFWYRIGSSGGQKAVYSLNLVNITQPAPNTLITESANSQVDFTINYALTGRAAGSGSACLDETITVRNLLNSPMDFHLFQYADFDLAGTAGGDTVQLGKTGSLFTTATQAEGSVVVNEILLSGANHGEAGVNNQEYLKLTSGTPLTLNDNSGPAGPGNAAYAFEWDFTLAAKGLFSVSLEKHLDPVPEPATWSLLALVLLAWALKRRTALAVR
jgi:hypothetical protein